MKETIQEILDADILAEQAKEKERQRSGKWNPSSFMQCYRRQVWNRKNVEPSDPPPILTLRVFRAGKVFHKMIEALLPPHQTEVEVNTDTVHGFADIVTEDEVVDMKSQNSYVFKLMSKPDFDIHTEKLDNIIQVCSYAHFLGKPKARLCYLNKDTLEIKEFQFVVADYLQDIEQELETLNNLWDCGVDPEANPRLYKGKECKYCQFETKCKGKPF